MAEFLALHNYDSTADDEPYVYVNIEKVTRLWREGHPPRTVIRFDDGSIQRVTEEPAEIFHLIEGFIL